MDRKEYQRQWREKNREKIRQYHKEWRDSKELPPYKKRTRNKNLHRLREHLGGKCVGCGTTENLQFDHIDRTQKCFSISENRDKAFATLLEEVNKCQLLCKECHRVKTMANHDNAEILKGYRVSHIDHIEDRIVITYEKY